MKKIAAHNDEIDLFADRVFLQNIDPRIEKITRRFVELITRAAEMHVRNVKKFHSVIITFQSQKIFQRKDAKPQKRKEFNKMFYEKPKIFSRLCTSATLR